jgi:branched-chain amino acid transport system substrate-binding protein
MEAITATNLNTMVGPINWANGPVKNVTKTPLAGGQWQRVDGKLELKIVNNMQNPQLPLTGELKLLA